jgi:hypothetical protein
VRRSSLLKPGLERAGECYAGGVQDAGKRASTDGEPAAVHHDRAGCTEEGAGAAGGQAGERGAGGGVGARGARRARAPAHGQWAAAVRVSVDAFGRCGHEGFSTG